ncbi:MAG: STAS-like domain-containing protein [Pedobacter sp.]|uniref:STAS-like domain-containing protein n=1 Tax=Pedobacter sp. TaxID=1411316 RepID=UPI00356778A6
MVTQDDGEVVYARISRAWKETDAMLILDFQNIETVAACCLNMAIGRLYSEYTSEVLNTRIKVENIDSYHIGLTKKVVENAKEYYKKQADEVEQKKQSDEWEKRDNELMMSALMVSMM